MTDRPKHIEQWSGDMWNDAKVRNSGRIPVGGMDFVVGSQQALNPAPNSEIFTDRTVKSVKHVPGKK